MNLDKNTDISRITQTQIYICGNAHRYILSEISAVRQTLNISITALE
jgi:hypothetical protein